MSEAKHQEFKIDRVNVLGVGISALNMELALTAIERALSGQRKGYVCVSGVHGVMEAQRDAALRRVFNQAFLCTPDGMPMVWMGRLNGRKHMERVYGPDLMLAVMERSVARGYRHFFYGGNHGAAAELRRRMEQRFAGVQIVGTYEPPFRPLNAEEQRQLQAMVAAAKPDILWVGISTPKQDRFMAEYLPRLDATLMFGVGAAFDFHIGRTRQAPRWMQRSGLEWFFRLCVEPRRLWKRYAMNNPAFIVLALCQLLGLKKYELE